MKRKLLVAAIAATMLAPVVASAADVTMGGRVRVNLSQAGYQVVKRGKGKGVELRRDAPKVGRNDQCPCGSGKKYKHCHLRQDQAKVKS